MGQFHTREIVLLGSAAQTTTGNGVDINVPAGWQAAKFSINVSAASGTSPTLNVIVQDKLGQALTGASADASGLFPTGTAIYDDLLAFSQMTTTGTRIARMVTGPLAPSANSSVVTSVDYATLNGTLTAGNARVGPATGLLRVTWVIAGTSPSFTFSVVAQLVPFST